MWIYVCAELTAMLDATGKSLLSFVPAFPQINRVTVNGVHYIEGIPVDRSVFGSDPFEPVTEANVEKLIHQQCETNVQTISAGPAHPAIRPRESVFFRESAIPFNSSSDAETRQKSLWKPTLLYFGL